MTQSLELASKGKPMLAVALAFGRFFTRQGTFKSNELPAQRVGEQRALPRPAAAGRWVEAGQLHQQLGGTEFSEPKSNPGGAGTALVLKEVSLDQPPNHRPILVTLRFLGLNEVRQRKQFP